MMGILEKVRRIFSRGLSLDQNKLTTIRVNPRVLPKVGDIVKIKVNPAKMHLFAPSTELRLN